MLPVDPGTYVHPDQDYESMVDPWKPEPLYRQLAELLRSQIRSGKYQPGDRLPSEATLQQEHGLARDTVRAALDLLREEGLVVTFPGRGTFVPPDET